MTGKNEIIILNGEDERRGNIYAKMGKIAAPIALQGVVSSSLGVVDNIMVGSLGESALASVGIAMQIFFLQYMLLFGFISGCGTFTTQFFGAGDRRGVHKTLGFASTIGIMIGMIFFTVAFVFPNFIVGIFTNEPKVVELAQVYMKTGSWTVLFIGISMPIEASLRGTQQTMLPFYTSAFVFSLNTFLNYMLIYGNFGFPHLGVKGAALATVISRFLEMVIMVTIILKGNYLKGSIRDYFDWNKKFLKRIYNNVKSTTANEVLWTLGQNLYVVAFAKLGVTSYAAYQAANNINGIFIFAGFSVGDAALILIGEQLGRRENEYAEEIAKKMLKIGTVIGAIGGLGLYFIGGKMVEFFNLTSQGAVYSDRLLLVMGIAMIAKVFNTILVIGILRAGGDTKFAMIAECSAVWLLGVPVAFVGVLIFNLPIYSVYVLISMSEIAKGVVLIFRFKSQKWNKNMINDLEFTEM
ncbi:MATE family efflux transporter [Eubacteriales bacterium KG127]